MNGPGARAGSVERRALAAASALAAEHGLRADRALVLHSGSNVLVELAPSPVVARVMTGTAVLHEQPERWLAREVAVLDFLAPSGLAVVPSPAIAPGPHRSDGLWMTCWALQEHRGRARLRDAARLGRALRALHDGLAGFAGELPGFAELCEDIERLRSKEYEGWGSSLQADYGHEVVRFLEESSLLDEQVASLAAAREVLQRGGGENEPFDTEVVHADDELVVVKAIERKSGLARSHRLPASLFQHHDYRKFAEVHAALLKQVGRPPFEVSRGERRNVALSFETLRGAVMELARQGVQLTRFKGLGEMNAKQLRETTMDPASRTLARVTLEDATAADTIFSMLMGDQVAPRREFIETHAKEVKFLDV